MRILPVLDLKGGQIVRAVAGRRAEYRPVVSQLARSADPLDVAEGFRTHLGLSGLYLADLDAIAGNAPNLGVLRQLHLHGFRLWVDAGLQHAEDADGLFSAGVQVVIAGLETLKSWEELRILRERWDRERLAYSLDLLPGHPRNPLELIQCSMDVVSLGIRSLIVLDLEQVGIGQGTGTEVLCRHLAERYPEVEVLAGGGIRSVEDLHQLRRDGVRGALIASAFHDGRIRRADLEALPLQR
jgi:phosphoribosylformimino-5-aminoimidazole carboxamide ribotide isomerase